MDGAGRAARLHLLIASSVLAGDKLQRLPGEAQAMMALERRGQIAPYRRKPDGSPGRLARLCQLVLKRKEYFEAMAGDDRFGDAVIVEIVELRRKESLTIFDLPVRGLFKADIFAVAADEKPKLEQGTRPQCWGFFAELAGRIGESQGMGKIEPADIVGEEAVTGFFEGAVEVQQVVGGRLQ